MNIHSKTVDPTMTNPISTPPTSSLSTSRTKRADILEAALALFVDRGFHGTAVPALAQRANVGAGTIYRYFENKDALVNELFRTWKMAIAEHVTAAIDTTLPPRRLFTRFWTRTIDFAQRYPEAFAFLELHHHASYLDARSLELEARVVALAESVIADMQKGGAVKDLPAKMMMSVIYGALVGFVRGAWEGRYDLDASQIACAEQCAWEAIAA